MSADKDGKFLIKNTKIKLLAVCIVFMRIALILWSRGLFV
jgi:hypothetical protein